MCLSAPSVRSSKVQKVHWIFIRCADRELHRSVGYFAMQVCVRAMEDTFVVDYIYGFVGWGVSKQSRWRHSVTVPSQDGWYVLLWQRYDNNKMADVLLWQRYDNNKMADMCYYGNVMTTTRWRKQVQSMTVYDSLWMYCWRCRLHL